MSQYILRKYCVQCEGLFCADDMIFYTDNGYGMFICQICSERENMVQTKQLKITAEIDGKIVPLENISTETFETIKALEKPKEIPMMRLADYYDNPTRLLLRPTTNIKLVSGRVYSFDTKNGSKVAEWDVEEDKHCIARTYKNVRPL